MTVAGLPYDVESCTHLDTVDIVDDRRRGRQELPQAGAENRLIVGDDDADGDRLALTASHDSDLHREVLTDWTS